MLPGKRLAAPDHAAVAQEWLLAAADRSLRNPAHRHAKRVNLRMCLAYRRDDRLEKSPMTGSSVPTSATKRVARDCQPSSGNRRRVFYVKTQIGWPSGAVTFSTGDSLCPCGPYHP